MCRVPKKYSAFRVIVHLLTRLTGSLQVSTRDLYGWQFIQDSRLRLLNHDLNHNSRSWYFTYDVQYTRQTQGMCGCYDIELRCNEVTVLFFIFIFSRVRYNRKYYQFSMMITANWLRGLHAETDFNDIKSELLDRTITTGNFNKMNNNLINEK